MILAYFSQNLVGVP